VSAITTFFGGLGSGQTVGGALTDTAGDALADTGLNALSSGVLDATKSALQNLAGLIGTTTSPDLTGAWFSATYWRVAGLAALLTLPFVFAAALQALLRSDPGLLAKVVFAYLPLSMLGVSLTAPIAMLLLSATDEMCAVVSATAVNGGAHFLDGAAVIAGGLSDAATGSPFFAMVVGMLTLAAALALALELLIREAAVYVVVLMLPLAFSAFVWPARRIWAIRLLELLISLILAKFVIVAVLSLAGSAFTVRGADLSKLLTAMALVLLSTFSPWVLLRILPFTELAAGAAGVLRHELHHAGARAYAAGSGATDGDLTAVLPAILRNHANQAGQEEVGESNVPLARQQPSEPSAQSGPAQAATSDPGSASLGSTPPDPPTTGSPSSEPAADPPLVRGSALVQPGPKSAAAPQEPAETSDYTFPLPEVDPDLQINTGPGDWLTKDE